MGGGVTEPLSKVDILITKYFTESLQNFRAFPNKLEKN